MDDKDEEELKAFDSTLQNRTTHMLTKVASRSDGARSVDSLILVIRCLGDTNQDVVRVLLRSKDDIYGSRELLELLLDYFNCSHKTLDFLNILEHWLHGATGVTWRLGRVKTALREFKSDKTKTGYGRVLLERALTGFAQSSDAVVIQQLYAKLAVVLHEQTRLHERLLAKKHEVDVRNVRRFQVYRKVSTVILASLYMGLMVCAAVSAVLSPALVIPPIAAVAAIAAMNPTEYTGAWMNHMWEKYEDKLKRRSELVNALMEARSRITVEDLEGIRVAVQGLQDKFQRFSVNAGGVVSLRKDPVVKGMVDDMEKKIDEFSRAVKDLQTKKDKCYRDVMDARAKILGTAYARK